MKLPLFVHNLKKTSDPDSSNYKAGDSKFWNSVIYYLCDYPNQKYKLKLHTHTA